VALTTIDAAHFSQFYEKFDFGPNGAVSLLNAGGIMLARSRDDGTYVGRDMSNSPLVKNLLDRPAASIESALRLHVNTGTAIGLPVSSSMAHG